MKSTKRLETKEEYEQAIDERLTIKTAKFTGTFDRLRLDELDKLIADFERRCDNMLKTMDVTRQGLAGMTKDMKIVDRREHPDALPIPFSTPLNVPVPQNLTKVWDFYYSHKEALYNATETLIYFNNQGVGGMSVECLHTSWFKDKLYTRRVETGMQKPDKFDDYEYIGTGTMMDTRMRGKWYEQGFLKQSQQ